MNFYFWSDEPPAWATALAAQLTVISSKLDILIKGETGMAVDITKIQAEIANNTTVTASVVALVQSLAAQIKAIPPSSDPTTQAALDTLTQTLTANDATLAAAVTSNTSTPAGA